MRLGQHFLVDENVIKKFVSFVDPNLRPLVEVGPGKGALTNFIKPDAVLELDERLAEGLRWANPVIGDARRFPLRARQVVSSLPYYITFDFFDEIIRLSSVKRLVLILQKDFVDKVNNYPTYISFAINYTFEVLAGPVVLPSAFTPRPKVYSQIVVMNRKVNPSEQVLQFLKCISKFRNKSLSRAGELCGVKIEERRKVRDFRPSQVLELLSVVGLSSS